MTTMTTQDIRYYADGDYWSQTFETTLFQQRAGATEYDIGSFVACTFVNCTFTGALQDYVFTDCTFVNCDLSQVRWDNAYWQDCVWDDATRGLPTMAEERERLTAVVRQIDAEPDLFDMSMWHTVTECGTAYCVGGWLARLFPDAPISWVRKSWANDEHNRGFALAPNASAHFYKTTAEALAWLAQYRAA